MHTRVTLHEGWTLRAVGGEVPADLVDTVVPATVPGCVHTDLLAAGLIPDPYLDDNETELGWIGRVDWEYRTSFHWGAGGPEVDLVADGLDTVATVQLNGAVVARTQSMHRSYRMPVGTQLRSGRNELVVVFRAGLTATEEASARLGPLPQVNTHDFNALRKMACNYGWDWGPDLVTAGIWRPIALETWDGARIASVRPLVDVTGTTGRLSAHVDLQRESDGDLLVEVDVAGLRAAATVPAGQTSTVVRVDVPDVDVWWPHGYGEQPLYDVQVHLSSGLTQCDVWRGRVGFRTVAVDTTPDATGTPFTFVVNGVPVFARGVNWIPDDAFPSRITPERYATRLAQARAANVNLIRVWGGGIYESEDFYDTCDELGLLVWQDFLFACAAYTEEEPLRGEVVAEAREAVTRLSRHPSLALWNGCNENIWGYEEWGWKESVGDRTWGAGYYFDILPGIVAELDPSRPYCPGSPYSMSRDRHPNDPRHGTLHIWDVWNDRDYTAYREYTPRFCSEFGFQGPPTWATLRRAVHDEPLAADSPGMLLHQKAEDGNGKLDRGLHTHLPEPGSFADWHWATSLNQARAVAFGVEHFRSLTPVCMGAVVWQLNDCWPVSSWAAIDGDGRRKPLWYALRHCFRDRMLTVQPRDGGLALVAVNDSAEPWAVTVKVSRRSFDGQVLVALEVPVDLAPRAATTIALPADLASSPEPTRELLLAEAGAERAWWPFVEDVQARLRPAVLDTDVERISDGYRVVVTAHTLVRDLALLADRLADDAEVDRMLVTLLPGESTTFTVTTSASLTDDAFADPLVLRSANQLVTPEVWSGADRALPVPAGQA